ncbi:hypothetical protein EYF80_031055 [Liparis tanakae]|uniref:Uncharacterized protein n=1 Tax=Liparis tanakae TaxID=230148 RepID=A0A4Z2GZR0_9TELE|nr:hypothetical protein EYF80_031055 [Liparis tanakae]
MAGRVFLQQGGVVVLAQRVQDGGPVGFFLVFLPRCDPPRASRALRLFGYRCGVKALSVRSAVTSRVRQIRRYAARGNGRQAGEQKARL